jgi:hypothetical protein
MNNKQIIQNKELSNKKQLGKKIKKKKRLRQQSPLVISPVYISNYINQVTLNHSSLQGKEYNDLRDLYLASLYQSKKKDILRLFARKPKIFISKGKFILNPIPLKRLAILYGLVRHFPPAALE